MEHTQEQNTSKWNKWTITHKDGLSFKQFAKSGKHIKLKNGGTIDLKDDTKCTPVIFTSGYPAVLYGFDDFYGPFFAVLDAKEWFITSKR